MSTSCHNNGWDSRLSGVPRQESGVPYRTLDSRLTDPRLGRHKGRNAPAETSAIVILSGGLDSTVSLAVARSKATVRLAVHFDYGQRSARMEERAARAVARHYRIPIRCLNPEWLGKLTRTALVDRSRRLPRLAADELDLRRAALASAKAVWVPNRNGLFVNVAASFAEALGCDTIVTGFNREEGATFPDNSPDFIHAVNRALSYSTLNHVRVVSHVIRLTKIGIVRLGRKLRAPLHLAWSCYEAGPRPCDRCESCLRRRRAENFLSRP